MSPKLLIIKFGGAVISYKDSKIPKARVETLQQLSQQIRILIDQDYKIILVHGAGSFAHGIVKKYDLHHGMKTNQQKQAFKRAQKNMLRLNQLVLDTLTQAGLNTVSLPPHTFITQNSGKLNEFDPDLVSSYLEKDIIPVLFGDMVLDDVWGCSVLSGDAIVCYLGGKLRPGKVIFLSDVEGIFDTDPRKNPHAKLIPEINNSNLNQVITGLSSSGRNDVTGEMQGKVTVIKKSLKGIPTHIINGFTENSLISCASGQRIGTKLLLD